MPDTRSHRGAHPEDARLFSTEALPDLRRGMADLCWLLDRGYATNSALKLVGDRYGLTRRQRIAVNRCAATTEAAEDRGRRCADLDALAGEPVWLDGYNVLTSVEAALGGGVILLGRDGCYRDMASVHGSYRKVAETVPALQLIGEVLARCGVSQCRWYLDSPVSNSGRLKGILQDVAEKAGWNWRVELVFNPDTLLAETDALVASSDSGILDACGRWVNLARAVIAERVPGARIVDLAVPTESS